MTSQVEELLARAARHLDKQEPAEARRCLDDVLRHDRDNARARALLARLTEVEDVGTKKKGKSRLGAESPFFFIPSSGPGAPADEAPRPLPLPPAPPATRPGPTVLSGIPGMEEALPPPIEMDLAQLIIESESTRVRREDLEKLVARGAAEAARKAVESAEQQGALKEQKLHARIAELEAALATAQAAYTHAASEKASLEAQIVKARARASELESAAVVESGRTAELQTENDGLRKELDDARRARVSLEEALGEAKLNDVQLGIAQGVIAQQQAELATLRADVDEMRGRLRAAQESAHDVGRERDELQQRLASLNDELQQGRLVHKQLDMAQGALARRAAQLEEARAEHDELVGHVEKERLAHRTELRSRDEKLQKAQERVAELSVEVEQLTRDLEDTREEAEAEQDRLRRELDETRRVQALQAEEIAALHSEHAVLEASVGIEESGRLKLQEELDAIQEELDGERLRMRAAQSRLQAVEAELLQLRAEASDDDETDVRAELDVAQARIDELETELRHRETLHERLEKALESAAEQASAAYDRETELTRERDALVEKLKNEEALRAAIAHQDKELPPSRRVRR